MAIHHTCKLCGKIVGEVVQDNNNMTEIKDAIHNKCIIQFVDDINMAEAWFKCANKEKNLVGRIFG